jgi:hypothetical protein
MNTNLHEAEDASANRTQGARRRLSITLSTKAAEAFEWLKRKTDADTESEVIRNALRLHYVLLQAAEEGEKFFLRDKDGEQRQVDLFVAR